MQGTPVNVDKFKTMDSNRLSTTDTQTSAEDKRTNMMNDCPDTTILMRYAQYKEVVLLGRANEAFDSRKAKTRVLAIWFSFNQALGKLPRLADDKEPAPQPPPLTEKEYSEAWVRLHNHCRVHAL